MSDTTPRLIKIGDAMSQLMNVAVLPNHNDTTANESISGRVYRQGWVNARKVIDFLFLPFERDHCKKSHEADLQRARDLLNKRDNYGS